MMLNTSIWNTDTASNKGYPVLRGMPDAVEVFAFEGDIQMQMLYLRLQYHQERVLKS